MKKKLAMVLSAAMLLGTCITAYAASDSGYAGTAHYNAELELSNTRAAAYINTDSDCYLSVDGYALTTSKKYYLISSADNATYTGSSRTSNNGAFRSAQVRYEIAASDGSGTRSFDLIESNYSDWLFCF